MIAKRVARRSGLEFSELGFGAAAIGNLYRPISDNQAHDVLEMALYAGMSYVDTAPHYGHGLSERRVGDVIRERRDVLLSTKVGRLLKADRSLSGCRMREGFCSPMPFTRLYDYVMMVYCGHGRTVGSDLAWLRSTFFTCTTSGA